MRMRFEVVVCCVGSVSGHVVGAVSAGVFVALSVCSVLLFLFLGKLLLTYLW